MSNDTGQRAHRQRVERHKGTASPLLMCRTMQSLSMPTTNVSTTRRHGTQPRRVERCGGSGTPTTQCPRSPSAATPHFNPAFTAMPASRICVPCATTEPYHHAQNDATSTATRISLSRPAQLTPTNINTNATYKRHVDSQLHLRPPHQTPPMSKPPT